MDLFIIIIDVALDMLANKTFFILRKKMFRRAICLEGFCLKKKNSGSPQSEHCNYHPYKKPKAITSSASHRLWWVQPEVMWLIIP